MEYILPIGIIIVLILIWISIWFVAVNYIAHIITRFTAAKWVTNKLFVLGMSVIVSFLVAFLIYFGWVITDPAKNDKTAYIEPAQNGYVVTVKGKKLLMVHDPVSWIFRETYDVSDSFLIPRKNGINNGNEIQLLEKKYKLFGTIAIDGNKMKIQLYYKQDQSSTCNWNGDYNLKTR